jgi:hypothetical protein
MNKLWIRNGKFVSDEYGRPLVCPVCPCSTCEEKIAWLQHLATVYSGTFYGEGYIRTPDIEELVAPAVEVFQAATIYTVTVNEITTRYIVTVGCGDDCPLGKRVLRDRESYIEKDGVCGCPALASFIENAEFEGHEVFGESILLFQIMSEYKDVRVLACYDDGENWLYIDCQCKTGTTSNVGRRYDLECAACFDYLAFEEAREGFIAKQRGSHSLYTGTFDGVVQTRIARLDGFYSDYYLSGGGSIDYRTYVYLLDGADGNRYLRLWDWDYNARRWVSSSVLVPSDATLSGYAPLFTYSEPPFNTIFGAAFTVAIPEMPIDFNSWGSYDSEQLAAARAATTIPRFGIASCNCEGHTSGRHVGHPYAETPSCDNTEYISGEYRYNSERNKWEAHPGWYQGTVYHLRRIPTNIGFLAPDGTYSEEITLPTLNDLAVSPCSTDAYFPNIYEDWPEGRLIETHSSGKEDPAPCPEIDPEEFE